ncbi:MAG: hypothetical protein N4A43_04485 [Alphaproteobacteria bacterium]|jgi:hypothetical protein|nr:hypothetical protein [Alphaproteobacteria bacterium]
MEKADKNLKLKKTPSQAIDEFGILSASREINKDCYGGALIVTEDLCRLDLDNVKNEEIIRDLNLLQKMPYGNDTREAVLKLADNCGSYYIEDFIKTYKTFKDKRDAKDVFRVLLNHVDEHEFKDFINMASEFPLMKIDDEFLYKALDKCSNRKTIPFLYICALKNISVDDEDKFINTIIDKTHPDFIHLLSEDVEKYCGEVKDDYLLKMFDKCPDENAWKFIDNSSHYCMTREGNVVKFSKSLLYLLSNLNEEKKLKGFNKIVNAVDLGATKNQKKDVMSTVVGFIGDCKLSYLYKSTPELAKNVCMFLNELEQKQKKANIKNNSYCENNTYELNAKSKLKSSYEVLTYCFNS